MAMPVGRSLHIGSIAGKMIPAVVIGGVAAVAVCVVVCTEVGKLHAEASGNESGQ